MWKMVGKPLELEGPSCLTPSVWLLWLPWSVQLMSILRSPELLLNVTGNFCDRNLGPNDEAVGSGEAVGFMA